MSTTELSGIVGRPSSEPARRGPAGPMTLRSAGASITGPRPDNQDSGCAGQRLIAVADGVGGRPGGALASSTTINQLTEQVTACRDEPGPEWLRGAVASANRRIATAGRWRPYLRGMATTLTALCLGSSAQLAVAHIGDSRGYLVRGGQLHQLTTDHTLVRLMLDAGTSTGAQASSHPLRSMLLAALHGRDDDLHGLETSTLAVKTGDRLLVCTHGLYAVVDHNTMSRILVRAPTPADAVAALLRAVSQAPARDNATGVVADVLDRRPEIGQPLGRVGAAVRLGPVTRGGPTAG